MRTIFCKETMQNLRSRVSYKNFNWLFLTNNSFQFKAATDARCYKFVSQFNEFFAGRCVFIIVDNNQAKFKRVVKCQLFREIFDELLIIPGHFIYNNNQYFR